MIKIDYLITENFNLRVATVEDGSRFSRVVVRVDLQMKRKTLQKNRNLPWEYIPKKSSKVIVTIFNQT